MCDCKRAFSFSKKFGGNFLTNSNCLTKGLMTLELLHYCLLHFKLSADARDMFIDLMLKFDLCYEVPKIPGLPRREWLSSNTTCFLKSWWNIVRSISTSVSGLWKISPRSLGFSWYHIISPVACK
jgi:hypothetical protein